MTDSRFSHLFRALRLRRHLSMNALARQSGVSASTISRWEAGTTKPCLPELESVLCILKPKDFVRRRLIQSIGAPRTIQTLKQEISKSPNDRLIPAPSSGGFLKALRNRRHLTQEETAHKLGIAQSTLARWEKGDHWPSPTELHHLCFVLGANEDEVVALTTNPTSLAPSLSDKSLGFEEALNWSDRVNIDAVNQTHPSLIELQYWQLIAGLWARYTHWGAPGLELFAYVLSRFSYMLLDAKPGMIGLTKSARLSQAKYFAEQALGAQVSQHSDTAFISMMVLSMVHSESRTTADLSKAHDLLLPWTTRKVSHRQDQGDEVVGPAIAGWALSNLSKLMERRGWLSAADTLSMQAIRTVRSFGKSVETRVRINDRVDMLLRASRFDEALDALQTDDPGSKVLNYWESVMWAEALLGIGKADQAIARLQGLEPGLETKDEAFFLERANSIRQRALAT